MPFSITILGSSGAVPAHGRHPSSQLVRIEDALLLIDCGEGTLLQMQRYKQRWGKISHIFISHLHGDHFFGLIGLLTTMSLNQRTQPIHIYAFEPLQSIMELQLKATGGFLSFPVHYHYLNPKEQEMIFDTGFNVYSFPVNHRADCCGFLFAEKEGQRKFRPDKAADYKLTFEDIAALKECRPVIDGNGKNVQAELVTDPPPAPRTYAYVTDTAYIPTLHSRLQGVNLLYHEATFLNDHLERAVKTYHTTALQAATLARDAGVNQLLLGHFSAKYADLSPLLMEAQSIFPNTVLAEEGETFTVSR